MFDILLKVYIFLMSIIYMWCVLGGVPRPDHLCFPDQGRSPVFNFVEKLRKTLNSLQIILYSVELLFICC